ncbi:MAG: hypothetical protein OK441_00615 [Thaumarchaeota archaeon]|nr:hypothetical protein [Nitrososphaerota archaeon]
MSKKHSSKFFRTYFASPDKTEPEAPNGLPRSIPDRPLGRTEVVTEPGDTAIAGAENIAQGVADCSPGLTGPDDLSGHGPTLDLGAEGR